MGIPPISHESRVSYRIVVDTGELFQDSRQVARCYDHDYNICYRVATVIALPIWLGVWVKMTNFIRLIGFLPC